MHFHTHTHTHARRAATHTERGRESGGASKQKLNFVSRLKLKIAFVVRVNSEGSPGGWAVAPKNDGKRRSRIVVVMYCCIVVAAAAPAVAGVA